MHPNYAYAHGALVKMAEHNVDPAAFVRAAVATQDPLALKIANAIVAYEKVAEGRISAAIGGAKNLMNRGAQGAAAGIGDVLEGAGGMAKRNPYATLGAAGALGSAGLAGAGAGADYAMAPADTMENKLRGLASKLPGVDLEQQSRLGYGAEQLGDYIGGLGQPG